MERMDGKVQVWKRSKDNKARKWGKGYDAAEIIDWQYVGPTSIWVGRLLAIRWLRYVGPMLPGQRWSNNQNDIQPTVFVNIGPTVGQFFSGGWDPLGIVRI